jgi:RNA polymerase sigma factor (sigma-70 family)
MIDDELDLWERYEAARKGLILHYLPVVDRLARAIARSAGLARWEDLRQDGAIGLMKAIAKFDPNRGVPFTAFARHYIRGAIFDSSEITRDLARRQEEIHRRIKQADNELTKTLRRNPTIEELAEKTRLTRKQIRNALDARGIAFPESVSEEDLTDEVELSQAEKNILIHEALSKLDEKEREIVRLHYLEDQPHEKIAEKLGIIPDEVIRIRQRAIDQVAKTCQRAIKKLNRRFDVKKRGGHDESGRRGK